MVILDRVVGRCGVLTFGAYLRVGCQISLAMATVELRVEDRIDGGRNWTPWKAMIILLLEEGELWKIVESAVILP